MAKFTCPYCYELHDLSDCNMKCSYQVSGKTDGCIKGITKTNKVYIPDKEKKKCLKCTAAKKEVICKHSQKEIPSVFLEGKSFSIALLGAKASGKSNYIGVLINEIRRSMTETFECSLNLAASEESKSYYENYYYKPLFEQGRIIQGTNKGIIPPMIFPLRFMNAKGTVKKIAALSFYDTAGENLDNPNDMLIHNRYIPNANGIILLLDPLQVPSIRAKLQGKMKLPDQNTDAIDVLSRIIENIRVVKNIKGTINTPLAVVFTKIDALEQFDILSENSNLKNESEHLRRGVFVKTDFESVNLEVQRLLENWLAEDLPMLVKNFKNYAFFGVSALGGIPNGDRVGGDGIKPRRVLDPLLWLLAENGYIVTAKR